MTATLFLLGSPHLELDGRTVPWRGDRRYQLLTYLAYQAQWVDRSQLQFLFWPDHPPQDARANLRQLLARVRLLNLPWLEVQAGRARWRVETDVQRFDLAVRAGDWSEALAAYGGPLLSGRTGDAPGEWRIWLERERVRQHGVWRRACLRAAQDLAARGAYLEAADLLEPLLADADLDEEVLRVQVGALLRAGGWVRARRSAARFVERQRDEYGLEPSAELLALLGRLKRQEAPQAKPPDPVAKATPTTFIGRDLELAEVDRLLTRSDVRLLTITGPGGIGKTRLALHIARQWADRFADGVVVVFLAALSDPAHITGRLADQLGLRLQGREDPIGEVIRHIGARELLLVLDNHEHLLEGVEVAERLLWACAHLRLLVTSRQRLGLQGEWLLPLTGLDHPNAAQVGPVDGRQFDAVQLFTERARRVQPNFWVTDGDLPALFELTRLVEGSPLALELAAVWTRALTLSDILRELQVNLDFLTVERGAERRHRSLRAVFEHSWRLLSPALQGHLRRLAVFRGGFRLEAARAVAAATPAALAALVDASLLRLNPDGSHDLHALLHQYAAEKLAEDPLERAETEARHAQYHLGQLSADAGRGESVPDADVENLRAAWRHAARHQRTHDLRRAALPLQRLFCHRARFAEGHALLGEALAVLDATPPPDTAALGCVLIGQAWCALRLGRYTEARALGVRGLGLVPPDGSEAVSGLGALASIVERLGDFQGATRLFTQVRDIARRGGLEREEATALFNLANVANTCGDHERAERHAGRMVALCERMGSGSPLVPALELLGYIALCRGRTAKARATLEHALTLARTSGQAQRLPDILLHLAEVALEDGQATEALRRAEEGLATARAHDFPSMESAALALLGRIHAALGDDGQARDCLRLGLRLAREHREAPSVLLGLFSVAEWRLGRDPARAADLLLSVERHPAAYHRLREMARQLRGGLKAEAAGPVGGPARTDALDTWVDAVLADLDADTWRHGSPQR